MIYYITNMTPFNLKFFLDECRGAAAIFASMLLGEK